jgi:ATP-dependent helicase HrpB
MLTEHSCPIDDALPRLRDAVLKHQAVVLQAPPGAGKTTRVPLALLDILPAGKIVMLEPRRLATVSAARWMAHQLGEEAGGTVGYAIRFDTRITSRTRIEVVTEGVLTRRIQADPGLAGTSLVIFDEFHERSLHADLALALCLDVQKGLRPDLKLLIMSATVDADPIAALLGGAPVVASAGRAFPVEERFLGERQEPLPLRVSYAVITALRETNGDILVFLPGTGEIRAAIRELEDSIDLREERLSLHPLYGDLPFDEQERAILPSSDHRKVVLATNIAETSLTIEGVRVVIDGGLTRMLRYDPVTGMNRLLTVPLSRASAEQRRGRAGRLGPGVCYRLYGIDNLKGMSPYSPPEILVSDLVPLVLELAVWGIRDPSELAWLDPPPRAAWDTGLRLLQDLGGLDNLGLVTPAGREMVRLPLHPRLACLLLHSRTLGCLRLGADLAALLTEKDIMWQGREERTVHEPDILDRVEALRTARRGKHDPRIDPAALRRVERTATQIRELMNIPSGVEEESPNLVSRLLLSAYPDRICRRRAEAVGIFVHMQGRAVRVSRDSHLLGSPYLIAVRVDAGERAEGFVHLAAAVTAEVLREDCAGSIRTVRIVRWDDREKRVRATVEDRLGNIVLSSRPEAPNDDEVLPILLSEIRKDHRLLSFSREARQLQARVTLIRGAFPHEDWPDLSKSALFERPQKWLTSSLFGIRTAADFARIDTLHAIKSRLTWDQQRLLEERAPAAVTVPSGSRIKLDYLQGGTPVLAVRLQELFGLADTPTIANGRVRVLLHLLSPAGRPVQVTQDLRNFWNAVYPEVRKELRGRYPRHPWPDDPWHAIPTKRTKPRT